MRSFLFPLAFVLALAVPASAQECVPRTWTTDIDAGTIVLDTTTNDAVVHYVAIDLCQPGCAFSIWPYRETNGIPGLQRADGFSGDTACGNGDTFEL